MVIIRIYIYTYNTYIHIICIYNTHEHILYKMRGVKACHISFYVPPAAALQGVTHPIL